MALRKVTMPNNRDHFNFIANTGHRKVLSKECNFQSVTAVKYCEECIRDAFIRGKDNV